MNNELNYLPFWGMPSIKNKFARVTLELINYCANNCIFCCAKDRSAERRIMSKEDLVCVLKKFGDYSGNATLSDTGDSIILQDLPDKISLIKQYWPKCYLNLTTTLSVLRDSSYFKNIFDNGLDQIMLSLYVFDSELYSKFQGSKNFDIVMRNLKTISELGSDYTSKLILKKMSNFGKVHKIKNYDQMVADFDNIMADMGFLRSYKSAIIPVEDDSNPDKCYNSPIPCSVLWGAMSERAEIHANLDVVPCCLCPNENISYGNLRDHSLEQVFCSEKAKSFRKKWWNMEVDSIPVCRRCKYYGTHVNSMEEFTRIAAWIAGRLRGKRAIFWGNGEAFRRYGPFFKGVVVEGMIVDGDESEDTYGFRRMEPDILLDSEYRHLPLVIFKYRQDMSKILGLIAEKYHKPVSEIYTVPPSYELGGKDGICYYDVM